MGRLSKSIQSFLSSKQKEIDSDIENDQFVKVKDLTRSDDDSSSSCDEDHVIPQKNSLGRRVKFAEDSYPVSQSILRKQNNSSLLLEELTRKEPKFIGKKVNRKDLELEETFDSRDYQVSSNSDLSNEFEQEADFSTGSEDLDVYNDTQQHAYESDKDDVDSSDNDYFQQLKTMNKKEQREDGKIQLMAQENAVKGRHMKNQIKAIDSAYQCRILLQKVLLAINRWPDVGHFENLQNFMDTLDSKIILNQPIPLEIIKDTMENLIHLLSQNYMLELSCMNNFDTDSSKELMVNNNDDRLESFSNLSIDAIWDRMATKASHAWPWIDETLDKWWQKTHFNAGAASLLQNKYKAIHQNLKTQIDFTLKDEGRLLKRTRQNRSCQARLVLPNFTASTSTHLNDNDDAIIYEEIFDDSDFYKLLLKDIIESKVSTMQQNELTEECNFKDLINLKQEKNKKKKLIVGGGGKGSKGKIIRYDIHPKLVNFMTAIPFTAGLDDDWTDTKMDELYQSLPKVEVKT